MRVREVHNPSRFILNTLNMALYKSSLAKEKILWLLNIIKDQSSFFIETSSTILAMVTILKRLILSYTSFGYDQKTLEYWKLPGFIAFNTMLFTKEWGIE